MIIVAAVVSSCLVSSWIISHLGRKPVNGGSPAKESNVSMKAAFRVGIFVHEVIIVDSLRALVLVRVRNTVVVIRE